MQKILIADTAEAFAGALAERLQGGFEVNTCCRGEDLLALLGSFDPDMLVLDLTIPGVDPIAVLRSLQSAGKSIPIIATIRSRWEIVESQLADLGVWHVVLKPCDIGLLAAEIHRMCVQRPKPETWYLLNETENMLLGLGFSLGPNRFKCVREAILVWYRAEGDMVAKQLYPEVARICGGSYTRVEKAIRDAKNSAFKRGNPAIWRMYFPVGKSEKVECPTNEEFISRIAGALAQKARQTPPAEEAV